ncbi:MAG: NAD(P)-dependent oxidoreductase [Chloroflexi bacterium]|nr:NAD(P)-dependent oxidoreductase [Chloroflexota bacterium]
MIVSRLERPRIGVAVVGTGFFGAGLLRRLAAVPDFEPRVVANRTLDHALDAIRRAGIASCQVVVTHDAREARAALNAGRLVVTSDLLLPAALDGVDVVAEATGDVVVGSRVAHTAIQAGKHVVAANPETQATVGPILRVLADANHVIYSDVDGDEPGLIRSLLDELASMGLEVAVAGNCKGVLKRYATPESQAGFAARFGLKPWIATAAADGTKLNFELTVVANASGLTPAVRGMRGPSTDAEHLVEDYHRLQLLDGGHYVDYAHGLGSGVFAIVRSDHPEVQSDFRYLKLGEGPYYAFVRPLVMCHYHAPRSISRAAWLGEPTVAPLGAPVAETIAFAKRDLEAGAELDGIGGFDLYGLIVRADEAARECLVPIGVAQYGRLRRSVRKDEPLEYDAVEFASDNFALQLRRQQDALFGVQVAAGAA